jgi:hypothetical protein
MFGTLMEPGQIFPIALHVLLQPRSMRDMTGPLVGSIMASSVPSPYSDVARTSAVTGGAHRLAVGDIHAGIYHRGMLVNPIGNGGVAARHAAHPTGALQPSVFLLVVKRGAERNLHRVVAREN